MSCIFCDIIEGKAPGSRIYEDDIASAFLTIHATRPGESLVIPKQHIDHFTDLPDALAAHLMVIGQHIGRKMMEVLKPSRIGYVVHGFGVAHAHLIVLPIHDATDITSARHARQDENGQLVFDLQNVPAVPRQNLDVMADLLRIEHIDQKPPQS